MTPEQQLIEALQITIKTQAQLIEFLKGEVERLKADQIVQKLTTPYAPIPGSPYPPSQPWPLGPGLLPYQQPYNPPLVPPYVITYTGDTFQGAGGPAANRGSIVGSNIKCVTTTPLEPINMNEPDPFGLT